MEAILNRIAQAPLVQKLALLAVLVGLVLAGYYYFVYSDILDEQAQNEEVLKKARKEEGEYQKRVEQYNAFVMERNQLRDERKELLRILPSGPDDDIEQFIEGVNAQVEAAGLSKVSSVREESKREEMYERMPVHMSLVGSFQQINKFFKNVGELQRIVTVAELQLSQTEQKVAPQTMAGPAPNAPLKADFIAQTFRLLDTTKPAAAAANAGAPGAPPAPPKPPAQRAAGGGK